jgi:N-acylneuraminate cytidylyltransferase
VIRRQDLDRYLRVNGNFYLWRSAFVRRLDTSWLDEGAHAGLEIPEAQAFSIDDDYEFRLIEALVAAGLIDLPWMETS